MQGRVQNLLHSFKKLMERAGYKWHRKGFSIGASFFGRGDIGNTVERGSDMLGDRYEGMSPEWRQEHDEAFAVAQNEAKGHFHRCPKCKLWVCDNDWNEQDGLCVDDAPRENVKSLQQRAKNLLKISRQSCPDTGFSGEIERKQTVCPECGKPAGLGKFCNNCGGHPIYVKMHEMRSEIL